MYHTRDHRFIMRKNSGLSLCRIIKGYDWSRQRFSYFKNSLGGRGVRCLERWKTLRLMATRSHWRSGRRIKREDTVWKSMAPSVAKKQASSRRSISRAVAEERLDELEASFHHSRRSHSRGKKRKAFLFLEKHREAYIISHPLLWLWLELFRVALGEIILDEKLNEVARGQETL